MQNINEKRADQPFKNVRHPTATPCCLHWTGKVGNNSFSKAYVYARCFVQCYMAHYVIKLLISWSWQRRFLRLCVHKIYTVNVKYSIIYVYKRIYLYAPALEAAAPTTLMVWLWVRQRLNVLYYVFRYWVSNGIRFLTQKLLCRPK